MDINYIVTYNELAARATALGRPVQGVIGFNDEAEAEEKCRQLAVLVKELECEEARKNDQVDIVTNEPAFVFASDRDIQEEIHDVTQSSHHEVVNEDKEPSMSTTETTDEVVPTKTVKRRRVAAKVSVAKPAKRIANGATKATKVKAKVKTKTKTTKAKIARPAAKTATKGLSSVKAGLLAEFGIRPGGDREQALLALTKPFGKKVPFADFQKLVKFASQIIVYLKYKINLNALPYTLEVAKDKKGVKYVVMNR